MKIGLLLFALVGGAFAAQAGERVPAEAHSLGLTKFDRKIVDAHEQFFPLSCIPSAAELVLKLLGRAPGSYRDLQIAWQNKSDGCFRDFYNKTTQNVPEIVRCGA